jgi:hypothetical protein
MQFFFELPIASFPEIECKTPSVTALGQRTGGTPLFSGYALTGDTAAGRNIV